VSGPYFVTYSYLGSNWVAPQYYHRVRDTMLDAWAELAETHPDVVFSEG